jgi:hypothetical protein
MSKKTELDDWCADIRKQFIDFFGVKPVMPGEGCEPLHERMMRVGAEARHFQIGDDREALKRIAHHTLLRDAVRFWSDRPRHPSMIVYGTTTYIRQ